MNKQVSCNGDAVSKSEDGWLIMVRHTAVDENLRGVCYGASDVDLSAEGRAQIGFLATKLAALVPNYIVHSGLSRALRLADSVANRLGRKPRMDQRIAEFNFGEWELRRWDDIHSDGHDIARLIHEPESFAPPGGETVLRMHERVIDWYKDLPSRARILAISHGGPISTLRGSLNGAPPASWPRLVPGYGGQVRFDLPNSKAAERRCN